MNPSLGRCLAGWLVIVASDAALAAPPLPQRLADTGLYTSASSTEIDPAHVAFAPQYPLWSDGTRKRRWLSLPRGTAIDAARVDAWEFPPGTRLWKEFAYERAVETRLLERLADGTWRYATYVWNADGSEALLAPAEGVASLPVEGAPGGHYAIPSEADCRACHEGAMAPVLGFSALQLSSDRDALAPHADASAASRLDLRELVERGLLRNLPASLLESPPRVAAASPIARAALGYLHANCAHCHHRGDAAVPLALTLAQEAGAASESAQAVLRSALGAESRYLPPGGAASLIIVPGQPQASVLALRMHSRDALVQMPPVGTRAVDAEGLALVQRWIAELKPTKETSP